MATIQSLQKRYQDLDRQFEMKAEAAIDPACLLAFDYDYAGGDSEVVIDMDEFTAVCPWTGLPDFGSLGGQLRTGSAVHRVEVAQILSAVVHRCRHRAGARGQPHPSRPCRGVSPRADVGRTRLQRARRSAHDRHGEV